MGVDPALRRLLDSFDDGSTFELGRARAVVEALTALVADGGPADDATDAAVAGVAVREYAPPASGRGPALVWFHGGGFVTGGLDAVDPMCREVLARTGAPLTSVDYRLAPEHPFPAALEDCVAVLRELAGRGPVALGGDSAGGALAVGSCLAVRSEGLPVLAQLLITPMLDCTLTSPSATELGTGYGLTRDSLQQFVTHYLQGGDPRDPRCSPLHAPDLTGLPPAVVVTAEYDPLRDDGEAYAARLAAAGVPVRLRRFDAMVHGFTGMASITPVADEAMDWAVEELVALAAGPASPEPSTSSRRSA